MPFVWWCTFSMDLNELGLFKSASCVCLRAVSAAVESGSDCISRSVATVNGGSVAEQQALSRLTDQEHEVSTWCSLDIVSMLSQSFLPSCDSQLAAAQYSFQGWHLWGITNVKINYANGKLQFMYMVSFDLLLGTSQFFLGMRRLIKYSIHVSKSDAFLSDFGS